MRTRVHTLYIPQINSTTEIYANLDPLAYFSYLTKSVAVNFMSQDSSKLYDSSFKAIKTLFTKFQKIYPSHIHSFNHKNSFISPKSLMQIPSQMLAFFKGVILNIFINLIAQIFLNYVFFWKPLFNSSKHYDINSKYAQAFDTLHKSTLDLSSVYNPMFYRFQNSPDVIFYRI